MSLEAQQQIQGESQDGFSVTMSMDAPTILPESAGEDHPDNILPSDMGQSAPEEITEQPEQSESVEKPQGKLSDKVPDNPEKIREEANQFLTEKGIDLEALENAYAANGELSEEHYKKLADAGFPKKMVDTYIAGMEAAIAKAGIQEEQFIRDIQDSVGGEAEFITLQNWVATNLSPEDVDAWNEAAATNNPQLIKAVLQNYHQQYINAVGQSPQYLQGGTSKGNSAGGYQSWEEVTRDMNDPRYSTNPAFNRRVLEKLDKSNL